MIYTVTVKPAPWELECTQDRPCAKASEGACRACGFYGPEKAVDILLRRLEALRPYDWDPWARHHVVEEACRLAAEMLTAEMLTADARTAEWV